MSNKGGSGDELHVIVVDEDSEFSDAANTVVDKYAFVSKATDAKTGSGDSNFYKEVINRTSEYICDKSSTSATNWESSLLYTDFTNIDTPFSASFTKVCR